MLTFSSLSGMCGKAGTPRAAMVAVCLMVLSGCSTLWKSSEEQSEVVAKGSYVFKLPASEQQNPSKHPSKSFPFEAPGLKLPAPRLEVNHEVRRELSNYLRTNANCISKGLKRQESLFPVLAKILNDEGVPEELLNLALIESSFRVEAASPAGAVGLWQFMSGTARSYGLEVSSKVDERADPILSTMAAARFLKNLYSKYNDWYLVLAAYNAGPGAIDKAVANAKRADYWTMVRAGQINPETARFVPKFIAASILRKLYVRYGNQVQLAKYVDRHIVEVSQSGNSRLFAFSLDGDQAFKRG